MHRDIRRAKKQEKELAQFFDNAREEVLRTFKVEELLRKTAVSVFFAGGAKLEEEDENDVTY